jgi:hypothetical protein
LIWAKREAEYFCEKGWTDQPLICPSGRQSDLSALARRAKAEACPYQPPGTGLRLTNSSVAPFAKIEHGHIVRGIAARPDFSRQQKQRVNLMLKFYFNGAPNPNKVALFLEESGLPYEPVPVDTRKGDQFKPEFLKVNPNGKVPASQQRPQIAVEVAEQRRLASECLRPGILTGHGHGHVVSQAIEEQLAFTGGNAGENLFHQLLVGCGAHGGISVR